MSLLLLCVHRFPALTLCWSCSSFPAAATPKRSLTLNVSWNRVKPQRTKRRGGPPGLLTVRRGCVYELQFARSFANGEVQQLIVEGSDSNALSRAALHEFCCVTKPLNRTRDMFMLAWDQSAGRALRYRSRPSNLGRRWTSICSRKAVIGK